jgi:hypothetical protein
MGKSGQGICPNPEPEPLSRFFSASAWKGFERQTQTLMRVYAYVILVVLLVVSVPRKDV